MLQAIGRQVHLQTHQELVGRLVIVTVKQPAEVGRSDVALPGHLGEIGQSRIVGLDVFPATFVGSEGGRLGGLPGRERFGNLQHQVFQQGRAQLVRKTRRPQPVLDQIVEDPLDLTRTEDATAGAWSQGVLLEQSRSLAAGKIDEVFRQRILSIGADLVRHLRTVREHAARQQPHLLPGENEGPLAAGDEFNGEVREVGAMDRIIRRRGLETAADHGQRLLGWGSQIEVEATCLAQRGARRTRGRAADVAWGWALGTLSGHGANVILSACDFL